MVKIPGLDMGKFIIGARKKLDFSQDDFGRLLGVTRIAVNRWEKGKSFPNKEHWELIKTFSKIKKPPTNKNIKKAFIVGGVPLGLFMMLDQFYKENGVI